jgi:Dolichyl-phosphate-mannose-protein mannosyltransferase
MPASFAVRVNEWVERHAFTVIVAFSAAFFLATSVRAWGKPFWHDEIFTLVVARLPTLDTMWKAQLDGLDLSPPLNTVITRAVHEVAGVGRVTSRLPPMIGFWTASVVLFAIVRRRVGTILGLAAAALPCFTGAYRFAYEARGYGLTLGLAALALYAWLEIARTGRRAPHLALMSLVIASGVWTHYFAALACLPVVFGEIVRQKRLRRVDWPFWTAVVAAGLATLPLLPLAMAGHSQARTFWGRTAGANIAEMYAFLFLPVPEWGALGGFAFLVALAVVIFLGVDRFNRRRRGRRRLEAVPAHELVAGLTFLALPVFGWLLGLFAGTGMAARYLVFTVIGLGFLLPIGVSRLAQHPAWNMLFAGLLVAGWLGQSALDAGRIVRSGFQDPVASKPLLTESLSRSEPLVVTNGIVFLQLSYYAPSDWKSRIRYLADPSAALTYSGSDTIDRGLLALARWSPISVSRYEDFTAAHSNFSVYDAGAGWLLDRLRSQGASIEKVGNDPGAALDVVHLHGVSR